VLPRSVRDRVAPEVREHLAHDVLAELARSFDLAEQHGSLNHGQAVIGERLLAHGAVEPAGGLLPDEEGRELRPDDLEDQGEVLPDELVVLGHLVADRAERTASRHPELLLEGDLGTEPLGEVVPRSDVVVESAAAIADLVEVGEQDLMHEALLVLEVMVELPLPGSGRLDDLVGARGRDSLLVEEVRRRAEDPPSRLVASSRARCHSCLAELYQSVCFLHWPTT